MKNQTTEEKIASLKCHMFLSQTDVTAERRLSRTDIMRELLDEITAMIPSKEDIDMLIRAGK